MARAPSTSSSSSPSPALRTPLLASRAELGCGSGTLGDPGGASLAARDAEYRIGGGGSSRCAQVWTLTDPLTGLAESGYRHEVVQLHLRLRRCWSRTRTCRASSRLRAQPALRQVTDEPAPSGSFDELTGGGPAMDRHGRRFLRSHAAGPAAGCARWKLGARKTSRPTRRAGRPARWRCCILCGRPAVYAGTGPSTADGRHLGAHLTEPLIAELVRLGLLTGHRPGGDQNRSTSKARCWTTPGGRSPAGRQHACGRRHRRELLQRGGIRGGQDATARACARLWPGSRIRSVAWLLVAGLACIALSSGAL